MNRRFYCDDRTVVETAEGKVRGCFLNDHYYFLGIPYAEAKRFRMPEPVPHWDGVLDAVTYGPVAPTVQKPDVTSMNALTQQPLFGYRFWPEDEKCQYLNVWTRSTDPSRRRPVMVWIHGGGLHTGSSVEQMSYDGANLCRDGDLVVVSMNHRLNILGYLDVSDFGGEYRNSANVGQADLVEALKWVRRNIAFFGGDPDNVTLFGHSGGGTKIQMLLQTPSADGLYHRAIFMSGVRDLSGRSEDGADGRRVAAAMADRLGLTKENFSRIEDVPFERLREVYLDVMADFGAKGIPTGGGIGCVRNDFYLGSPMAVGLSEYARKIPMMAGSVQAESVLYAPQFHPYTVSAERRQELLAELFGDRKDELIASFEKAFQGADLMDLYNLDWVMRLGALEFLDFCTSYGAPLYCYLMTYHFGYFGGMPSFHGACLPMAFGNTEYVDAANEPDAVALSQKMHQAWINFATNGDPNGGDVPQWRPYTAAYHGTMVFDRQCGMMEDEDREVCMKFREVMEPRFRNQFRRQ